MIFDDLQQKALMGLNTILSRDALSASKLKLNSFSHALTTQSTTLISPCTMGYNIYESLQQLLLSKINVKKFIWNGWFYHCIHEPTIHDVFREPLV